MGKSTSTNRVIGSSGVDEVDAGVGVDISLVVMSSSSSHATLH
jgi:hypothetical protein